MTACESVERAEDLALEFIAASEDVAHAHLAAIADDRGRATAAELSRCGARRHLAWAAFTESLERMIGHGLGRVAANLLDTTVANADLGEQAVFVKGMAAVASDPFFPLMEVA